MSGMSSAEKTFQDALGALNGRNFADAERLFHRVLKQEPAHIGALNLLTVVLMSTGRFTDAEGFIAKAVRLNPGSDVSFYNYGLIAKQLGKPALALEQFGNALRLNPNVPETWNNRGTVFNDLGRYDAAIADFDRALALNSSHADAVCNKGKSLNALARHDEALAAYDRALALRPELPEAWLGRGNALANLKRHDAALTSYDRALAARPGLADAWLGRGNVLAELKRSDEAFAAYHQALALRGDLADAWLGRGHLLAALGRRDDALAAYDAALAIKPGLADAWLGRGNVLSGLKRYDGAFAAYDKAFAIDPDLPSVEGARLHAKMQACDWRDLAAECDHAVRSNRDGRANVTPFTLLGLPCSAADQLRCAEIWVARNFPAEAPTRRASPSPHDKIRIGYVSADFHQHATAYLAAGMFQHHDRSQFEVAALSLGPDDGSELRRRLERCFDRFDDCSGLSDAAIAAKVAEAGIDILVDLKGFTGDARFGIFAHRPAPIQVSYLGYPGTTGVPYIDYVIADQIVIPAAHRQYYSEKVACLPHSYQVNDATRAISEQSLTRADCGLPADGFVFCCFNNTYKILPDLFDRWMLLLDRIAGSVLWLFEDNPVAAESLRREAGARGIDPARLVFAPRRPLAEHLARHRLADLFLDTLPYNAHTTASDALWAGLPVLTQIGETFAGRVAASLLHAVGLPELVTETAEAYDALALDLAQHPERLAGLKRKLAENRLTTPLFDTARFTHDIEQLYRAMDERHRAGLPPDHIVADGTIA